MTIYDYIQLGLGIVLYMVVILVLLYLYYLYIIVGYRVRFNDRTYRRFLKKRVKSWSLYGGGDEKITIYWYPFGPTDIGGFSVKNKDWFHIQWIMDTKNDVGKFRYARYLRSFGYRLEINYYDKGLDN